MTLMVDLVSDETMGVCKVEVLSTFDVPSGYNDNCRM